MKKDNLNKFIIFIFIFLVCLVGYFFIKKDRDYKDTIEYDGKVYLLLEYSNDIFTYNFNNNSYYEEDVIYPLVHDKWDAVYFNGDLFILDSQVEDAYEYYLNDDNYEWFISYEEEIEKRKSISISNEELNYLYNIETVNDKESIRFDDIKMFVDIVKISDDGFIIALINLVHYEDSLYWKSEIMNDKDEEYIIKLPNSLSMKIFDLIEYKEDL